METAAGHGRRTEHPRPRYWLRCQFGRRGRYPTCFRFEVGRVVGLLDCEVLSKRSRAVGLRGYSDLSADLACDGTVLPDLFGLVVE